PLRFAFGVHFHQPVGNFDHVFEQHVRDVYRPLLERLAEREFFPIAIHLSGPLLEWLEEHESGLLDRIARLAEGSRLELLLSGFYEPVLAALPREDRVEQIHWMRQAIKRRFGVEATGLWLTEGVYDRGWLTQFLDAMGALIAAGEIRLTTLATALAEVPSGGLAYLPTASYREMEGWALPPDAASRLARLERDLGAERLAGPDGALVRGAHWRNFFVRYPESNRMHKKMQALSALCRRPAGGGGG